MLWYKAWLETRWRFVIGLVVLALSACGSVLAYPQVVELLPLAEKIDAGGALGRIVAESAALARDYRGYVWSQWFFQNMPQQWALFAVLLGAGGLVSQASAGGGALFTLSLPATRRRVLAVRAAIGLLELLALALLPSLVVPLLSPAVGQSYGAGDALVHGMLMFAAGAVFFAVTMLLSTVFRDVWRPALIVLGGSMVIAICEQLLSGPRRFGLFHVMSGEAYFRDGSVPWPGLLVSMAVTAAVLYAAAVNIDKRDF